MLHDIKVRGEAASTDGEAAARWVEDQAQIINEDDYTKQQTLQWRQSSPSVGRKSIWSFHSLRGVNAWLQSFAYSLIRG